MIIVIVEPQAPNSPYDSSIRYDAIDSVNETSKYFSKNQIILGLPFYGYDYSTDSNQPGANITNEQPIHIEDAINNSQIYGRIWDSDSNTPWYCYKLINLVIHGIKYGTMMMSHLD